MLELARVLLLLDSIDCISHQMTSSKILLFIQGSYALFPLKGTVQLCSCQLNMWECLQFSPSAPKLWSLVHNNICVSCAVSKCLQGFKMLL